MEKIKILHISETFITGVYTYIKQLSNYAESNGNFETYIIYSGERTETDEFLIKGDFPKSIHLIRIDMSREISPYRDIKSLIQIAHQIRKIKPDVIHVHSSKAGILGRIARIFYPKSRLFYTPHGYSFIRKDISKMKRFLFVSLEKIVTKIFGGTIVACGDHEFLEAKKFGRAILIRNGVNIHSVTKYAKPFKNEKLTIGTSGRIYFQKNPDLFNQIALRLPEYNFIWIGEGEFRSRLTAKNVTITGWNTYEDSLKMVNELDIFISTSLWEGLPFSIIEAMALSKPILSSDIEGNEVTINQNKSGYICKSLEDFVESIIKLENQELRQRLGAESFKIADTLFNMDKNIIEIINLYSDVKKLPA